MKRGIVFIILLSILLISSVSAIDACCEKINECKDKDLIELFCRYKLGLQVKYVLENQDHCFLNCET